MRFARHWALSGAPRIGNLRNWLFVPGTPTVFQNRLLFVLTRPIEAQFCVFDGRLIIKALDYLRFRSANSTPFQHDVVGFCGVP